MTLNIIRAANNYLLCQRYSGVMSSQLENKDTLLQARPCFVYSGRVGRVLSVHRERAPLVGSHTVVSADNVKVSKAK